MSVSSGPLMHITNFPPTRKSILKTGVDHSFGLHHCFRLSASVQAFHTRSIGASNSLVITSSFLFLLSKRVFSKLYILLFSRSTLSNVRPIGPTDLPRVSCTLSTSQTLHSRA